jgi:hypothetical protein
VAYDVVQDIPQIGRTWERTADTPQNLEAHADVVADAEDGHVDADAADHYAEE